MNERVVLITGGARGIGRGVALELAKEGWIVAICYRTSQQDAEEVKQTIEGHYYRYSNKSESATKGIRAT